MDARQLIGKACWIVLGLLAINASARAQEAGALTLFTPITGQIENGDPQNRTFTAASDTVLSFKVEATAGDLDPVLEIVDSAGNVLIRNDDFNYPDSRDALLEAVTIPRTDNYTARVSGFDSSSGEYTLTMLAGFADIGHSENFNAVSNWRARSEGLEIDIADGNILLALTGVQQTGIALNRDMPALTDFYAQVAASVVDSQSGWIVGLTARQQNDETYYLLLVNNSGQWRFAVYSGDGEHVLRDWAAHPAIVPERTEFTLGLMAQSGGFDFFYNGQLFGQVADTTLENAGRVGLAAATTDSLTSNTVVQYDDLTITVPLMVNQERVIPQQLILNPPQAMVRELEHRQLIPAGGQLSLAVEESFVESSRPGVHPFILGRGTAFTNFVLAATVSWQALDEGATGCGLIFRSVDDAHYTLAYIDQTGGYGVSRREGDTFEPGIFGENSALAGGTRHLLVIANGNTVHYYIDGYYTGTLENTVMEGEIGNAVVNFDPVHTSCQFDDTWVWRWE
jgi:hypothetical protein